jgi:hypothetical protein
MLVVTCGCDDDFERLRPRARARVEHVVELAIRLHVELVEHEPVHVKAVLALRDGRQRLEARAPRRNHERLLVRDRTAAQLEVRMAHRHRGLEHDRGLVLVAGGRVHLGAGFLVREREQQRNASGKRRLPVLSRDLDIENPIAPRTVESFPAEGRSDDIVALPLLQLERLAGELAFEMDAKSREELARDVGRGAIEPVLRADRLRFSELSGAPFRDRRAQSRRLSAVQTFARFHRRRRSLLTARSCEVPKKRSFGSPARVNTR